MRPAASGTCLLHLGLTNDSPPTRLNQSAQGEARQVVVQLLEDDEVTVLQLRANSRFRLKELAPIFDGQGIEIVSYGAQRADSGPDWLSRFAILSDTGEKLTGG